MTAVGDTIRRNDGRRFRLCAADAGRYIISDLDGPFTAPHSLSPAELLAGFDVERIAEPKSEAQMLVRRDDEANERNAVYFGRASGAAKLPPEGSPEWTFAKPAADAILSDTDRLAAFEIGTLEVSPIVAALLDEYIAARDAEQSPRPRRRRARKDDA